MDWIGIGGLAIGGVALAVSIALWLFNPTPIRQYLGLESKPPPEPYYVSDFDIRQLRKDQQVGAHLPESDDALAWVTAELEPTNLGKGYRRFTLSDGRSVIWQTHDYRGLSENILMWKPGECPRPLDRG